MEVVFHYTNHFEKDLRKISPVDKKKMAERINRAAESFSSDKTAFFKYAYRPHISLQGGLISSLYILRSGVKIRVLCTIDDDPLFDQRIFTLLRIAKTPDEYPKIFTQLAEALYQKDLIEYGDSENGRN